MLSALLFILLLSISIYSWNKITSLKKELTACRKSLDTQAKNKTQEVYRFAEMGRLSAGLVHDLANPITAVMFSLDELEVEHGSEALKQIREGVGYIEECLASARKDLNDQKEKQVFCARSEVMRVIGFLEPKATNRGVGINAQLSEVKLYGESSKFGQVVSNLLDNAIDSYGDTGKPANTSVDISLRLSNGDAILSVKDNGLGINRADIDKIFRPFFTTKAELQGTGLGLSITKRIVEEDFGGGIEVDSTLPRGTIFQVSLPIKDFSC